MGADFFGYYMPYETDIEGALQKLRKREFEAGRYHGAYDYDENGKYCPDRYWGPGFDIGIIDSNNIHQLLPSSPKHSSIEEAIEDLLAMSSGTNSVLDLKEVSHDDHYGVAYMFKPEELIKYMGTDKPTREQFEKGFWDYADEMYDSEIGIRYTGYCAVIYKDGQPSELFFGGYTAD